MNPFCSVTTTSNPRPNCGPATGYRHAENVERLNAKNPHAVALGKMSSPEKAEAAAKNGAKGGRPVGS